MTITYPYWNSDEVISSEKLNSMVQAIINGDPLAVKVSNATKNDVNQLVNYLSSLHNSAKNNLNSATSTSDLDTAYNNMIALVSNKLGSYANDDTVDLYSTGIRASIITFLQAYDTMMSNDRLNNKNTDNTLNSRIDTEAGARESADNAINTKISGMQANGGGRNLVANTNTDIVVDATSDDSSNWTFYKFHFTEQPKQGDLITVSAQGTLTGTGNLDKYRVILFDVNNSQPRSQAQYLKAGKRDSATLSLDNLNGDGDTTLLIYAGEAGETQGKKNVIHHLMVEKGTIAHDWSPAPEDTNAKITDLDDKTLQNRGTVDAPDFNSLTQAGYYTITKPYKGQNYPTTNWGTLEVSGQVADFKGLLNQKYVSDNGGTIYTRQYNAGTKVWTAWVQMANTNDVEAKVNSLQIGGINLLKDTDKMTNTNYWGLRYSQSVQASYAGKHANVMGISLSDYNVQFGTPTSFIDYVPQIGFEQGTDYTVSFWTTLVNKPLLYLNSDDGDNHQHYTSQQTISLQASGREYSIWKQVTATFQPTVANAYLTFGVSTDLTNTVSSYWVSSFKLEKGNKATDFSPAPEDTDIYTSGRTITLPHNSSITLKDDRIIPRIYLPTYITDYLPSTELNKLATMGEYDNLFVPSATMATLTNRPTNPDTNAPLTGDCFFSNHFALSGNTVRAFQKFYSCDYNYIFIRSYNSSPGAWSNWSCLTPYA